MKQSGYFFLIAACGIIWTAWTGRTHGGKKIFLSARKGQKKKSLMSHVWRTLKVTQSLSALKIKRFGKLRTIVGKQRQPIRSHSPIADWSNILGDANVAFWGNEAAPKVADGLWNKFCVRLCPCVVSTSVSRFVPLGLSGITFPRRIWPTWTNCGRSFPLQLSASLFSKNIWLHLCSTSSKDWKRSLVVP